MEGEAGEFHDDWEVLQSSDEAASVNSSESVDNARAWDLEGIDGGGSEGMIRADYFSLDSQGKYVKTGVAASEEASVESDNPSWIDPGTEATYPRKESCEFWTDSGSDHSDGAKFGEFDPKHELGFTETGKIGAEGEDLGKSLPHSGGIGPLSAEFGDSGNRDVMDLGDAANSPNQSELPEQENVDVGAGKSGEGDKRIVAWWKVPLEFLKYCAFRANPVWTFSVAAAVMGFIILGRRLYKMKRKRQSLQLKVTMDDKKVSQFMSRAARLNEAFSVVKRVPVIRPSLPATGVTPWPVMSLR
ncbi:uncharacterized protein LOC127800271 [Diospyros lotus]|uniref:uncharacterized protein LOC127800271 n=1 Tax=Diospyros lotus TaxID=55363 RepID=UPI002258A647|nr:uncharacterized protein LOC127800271 [Diospyros lotus]